MNRLFRGLLPILLACGLILFSGLVLVLTSPAKASRRVEQQIVSERPLVWNAAASIPEPRAANLVQCPDDPDGFYLVGGVTMGANTGDTLYHFNAISNTWTITLTTMAQPRRGVATACYEGKIYVAGGWDSMPKDSFYIYDIAGDNWSTGPSLPDVLWGAALGAWNGRLYLVGGTRLESPWIPVDRVDVYDISTGTWTPSGGTPMLVPASFYGAVQRGPYLYAVGGFSGNFTNNVAATQRYDMSSDTWESGPAFTSQRALFGISMTESHLYAQGGFLNGALPMDLVEVLELSSWPGGAWTDLGDPLPRGTLYPAGACTGGVTGGEIWGVGGTLDTTTVYTTNLYRSAESCLGYNYALVLGPETLSGEGFRGGTVDYTLTVTNTGDTPDAYTGLATSTWTATVSGLGGALDPGQGRAFTVTVEVPAGAVLGDNDIATLTLTSQGDPVQQASAIITTTAVPRYGLTLSPGAVALSANQGAMVTYTLQLSNTGDVTDTFALAAGESGWTVTLSVTETTLVTGEGIPVIAHVAIPTDAADGTRDIVILTGTSLGDPLVSASSTLTTTVWWKNYLPVIITD